MSIDYVNLISRNFPELQVECFGDPEVYENLRAVAPHVLPSKEDLDAMATDPAAIIQSLFKTKLEKCNYEYEAAVKLLRGTYPLSETTTWPVQLHEAQGYDEWREAGRVGDPPHTPFLIVLSAERDLRNVGSGLEDLVDRVLNNNNLYSAEMGRLTAIRHSCELGMYMLMQGGDYAGLNAFTWSYQAP